MSQPVQSFGLIASVIALTLGIGYAGQQIHSGLTNFRSFDRSVTMKGLAQQDVVADLAIWPISYTETGNELAPLQDLMDARGKLIVAFLKKYGIKDDEIELQQVQVQDLLAQTYRQNNSESNRYILTQTYMVRTDNITAVDKASKDMGELVRQGVVFAQSGSTAPTYLYTKLNDIKPAMIAEATKNAREAAQEFAENSGQKVGGIKYASQGVFQILSRDETYLISESQQQNKTVRVVSTIQFYLED
ncbi:MAG TPA: SIMPL domain-containing protein [Alphaproteobacteria bacterium]|nr:SIMPL domain-containing protein [Alphaproteobacteria bacterium]